MSGIAVFSAVRHHCETASVESDGCDESSRVKESLPNYEFDIDTGGHIWQDYYTAFDKIPITTATR